VRASVLVCAGVGIASWLAHRRVFGNAARFAGDEATLVGLGLAACLLHVFVYGWPLGFPVPGPGALFFPFLATVFVMVHAVVGATAREVTSWRDRR
jgi:hypothetical protein